MTEAFQYNLLKASNALAKERGPCDAYQHTKYHDGILPIDTYKRDLDEIVAPEYKYDWILLELTSNNTDYGTAPAVRTDAFREQPPLCQTQPMESLT